MMVTGSLNDPRVNYWEPAKFVAKMRAVKTDSRMLVLKVRIIDTEQIWFRLMTPCLPAFACAIL